MKDEKEQGRQMGRGLTSHAASHFQRTTSKNRTERREGLLPAKYTPPIGERMNAKATAEIYEIAERDSNPLQQHTDWGTMDKRDEGTLHNESRLRNERGL